MLECGGWLVRRGSFGSIKSKRGRPRVGLHAKQTAPILNLARDVGRPIGSLPGISQGRFEAAIFREVEGLALEKARQDAKRTITFYYRLFGPKNRHVTVGDVVNDYTF